MCIRFKHSALIRAARKQEDLQVKPVKYRTIPQMRRIKYKLQDLPFLKRYGFENEDEIRMIYESKTTTISKLDIPIPLSCIERISLSPWIHPSLSSHIKQLLKSIPECNRIKIVRSTLIGNEQWKTLGEAASRQSRVSSAKKIAARRSTRRQNTKPSKQ